MSNTYKISAEVCSVVVGDNDIARLRAYLYEHTTVADVDAFTLGAKGVTYYIVTTKVFEFVSDDQLADARSTGKHVVDTILGEAKRLARYQCDRLASGLYGVYPAVGDYDNAQEQVSDLAWT